jgi:hypothetical protein
MVGKELNRDGCSVVKYGDKWLPLPYGADLVWPLHRDSSDPDARPVVIPALKTSSAITVRRG